MPEITDTPPAAVQADLAELRAALDRDVPATKALDRNLLIATWNLQAFGDLTEKWASAPADSPKRDLHALRCIAEIVSRFDVVALQEVRANLKCLRHMLKMLGPQWGLILTDVTKGDAGNGERMAFLFDTRKVRPSGLACELVVPKEELGPIGPDALDKQFARTPYAVSFLSGGRTFILVTLHIIYGQDTQRVPELKAIGRWMSEWAKQTHAWDHNLIALGDFNIDRHGDALYQAFTSTGLFTPADLNQVSRSIFDDPAHPNLAKFYDQIAWFTTDNGTPLISLEYLRGGSFDFTQAGMNSRQLTKAKLQWFISNHYPLWAEFSVRD